MEKPAMTCVRCGGPMDRGTLRASVEEAGFVMAGETMVPTGGRELSDLRFVIPGVPTSGNPVTAFLQGLREEKEDTVLPVTGWRCRGCGLLELYAKEDATG